MKTIKFIATIAYGLFVATFLSCAPVAYPADTPNPLDEPGEAPPTAEELHAENIRVIRGITR
jgi:hypothetical protein